MALEKLEYDDDDFLVAEDISNDPAKGARSPRTIWRWGCAAPVVCIVILLSFIGTICRPAPGKLKVPARAVEGFEKKYRDIHAKDPMLLFECRTAWCAEATYPSDSMGNDQWNFGPIEKCAEECLADDGCTGFSNAAVPFQKDKCLLWYNHRCTKGGQTGGVMFSLTLSRPTTCTRLKVSVTGKWVPMFIVESEVDHEVTVGTSEAVTEEWSAAMGYGIEEKWNGNMQHTSAITSTRSTSEKISHHFKPKDGGQAWQWQFKGTTPGKPGYITVMSDNVVQTQDRIHPPRCLPGYAKVGTKYQECLGQQYEVAA